MRLAKSISILAVMVLPAAPARAVGVFEPATGLYWLEVSYTTGLSYNEVERGPLYDLGWRHATLSEVCGLFGASWHHAGLTSDFPCPGQAPEFEFIDVSGYVLAVLGTTGDSYIPPDPETGEGGSSSESLDALFDDGGAARFDTVGYANAYWFATSGFPGDRFYSGLAVVLDANLWNTSAPDVGHLLVATESLPIPEPDCLSLLLIGFALLGWHGQGASRRA